ncbi:MAG: glutamate--cysteine ligase [Myxococcales bacterium]|nr:glutamate--cysteine ligase [Myxococcales bacterium]MCB9708755.1 glutamate--cysteine ligase [Myxococcales bacterium]
MPAIEQRGQLIRSMDSLTDLFLDACKEPSQWRIGVESEKFGIHAATGAPLKYDSPDGIKALLAWMCKKRDWSPALDSASGAIIALTRGQTSLTLEPGGQVELSGAPAHCVHDVCREMSGHLEELAPIAQALDIRWLALGFHPTAKQQDLAWVPKERYAIMREYLPTRGSRALDMMRRTCTVQVNMDFASEADAMRKLRVALKLQPIATAMFANSPFLEGQFTGARSQRARVWLDVDPDRCGLLPFAWKEEATFRDYAEWALDVPMFFFKRGTQMFRNTGQRFRAFLADGFEGERATFDDWELHLSTLFPEVRLKNTIEVRGADAQGSQLICAVPALWKGLLYDTNALNEAESLVKDLQHDTVAEARAAIAEQALSADLRGRSVRAWAEAMIDIALRGLERQNGCTHSHSDERRFLAPLQRLVEHGHCPADVLLAHIDTQKPLLAQLLDKASA